MFALHGRRISQEFQVLFATRYMPFKGTLCQKPCLCFIRRSRSCGIVFCNINLAYVYVNAVNWWIASIEYQARCARTLLIKTWNEDISVKTATAFGTTQ